VADDIAADTFVIALRKHSDFDPGRGPVRAWLYGIATNLVAQHRRAEKRRYQTLARAGAQELTPTQRAALYRLLAQTPGLTVMSHVTNVRGQTGVGVRSGTWKGSIYTIIFDRRTFAPLGMNWTGVSGPMKGTHNGEVVLKTAIVDRTPPLP
jgi:hypothetical protein